MALDKLPGVAAAGDGFITRSLNTQMTRKEFLAMGGALVLTALGVQNLIGVVMKHTKATSPVSLTSQSQNGFGSRKFGT